MREKIGLLTAKVDAAHRRIDDGEKLTRETLKEINSELKILTAHLNKGKGWIAAMLFLAGGTGAGLVKLFTLIGK